MLFYLLRGLLRALLVRFGILSLAIRRLPHVLNACPPRLGMFLISLSAPSSSSRSGRRQLIKLALRLGTCIARAFPLGAVGFVVAFFPNPTLLG